MVTSARRTRLERVLSEIKIYLVDVTAVERDQRWSWVGVVRVTVPMGQGFAARTPDKRRKTVSARTDNSEPCGGVVVGGPA